MGLPLSEAALRRRRRQRRRVAVFALAEAFGSGGGRGGDGSSLGVQDSKTSAVVPGESGVGGGCWLPSGISGNGSSGGVQDSITSAVVPGESGGGGGCWLPSGFGGMLASSSGSGHALPRPETCVAEQHACGFCGSGGMVDVRWHVAAAVRCLAEALELQGYVPMATGFDMPTIPVVQDTEEDACVFTAGTFSRD